MGMELTKRLTVLSLVSMIMLFAGCIGTSMNPPQKQEEKVAQSTESHPDTVENPAGEVSSPAEGKKDTEDIQTSPESPENRKSKDEIDKTIEEQPSASQHNDGKSASQSEPSARNNNTSEQSNVDADKDIDGILDDRIMWAFGGAAIALISVVGWKLFRRRGQNKDNDNTKEHEGLSRRHSYVNSSKSAFRVGNLHNIGRRDEQQDSFCLSDINDVMSVERKGIMAVVADGMGGLEGGAAISQLVADTFLEKYNFAKDIRNPAEFLYETAKAAEIAAEKYMERNGVDGGSTLVSVLIRGNEMHFLSVGDSHIYLITGGQITLLNKEHNFAAVLREKAERGEVAPDEPYVNPRRNSLTAYIGMGNFQIMDINDGPIFLNPGDKVLLCSDGVFNTLKDIDINDMLSDDAVTAAKRLETAVLTKGNPNQDNFTGVIVEYVDV